MHQRAPPVGSTIHINTFDIFHLLLARARTRLHIKWENQVIEDLQSLACVPRHYFFGRHGNKDVLVMELLSGEDMSALR